MTESPFQPIRKILEQGLIDELSGQQEFTEKAASELKLRPPKSASFGDLCSNIMLLICGDDKNLREQRAPKIIEACLASPIVTKAVLSDTGYINLFIDPHFWGQQLLALKMEGSRFGLENSDRVEDLQLLKPSDADDLVSARHLWNAEALSKLAELSQYSVRWGMADPLEARGFPTAAAISKCTEPTLRLALLGTGDDFAIQFSPMLATDKSYDNPAFCIPYAHSRIVALLAKVSEQEAQEGTDIVLSVNIDEISLSGPQEQKIVKFMCDWPVIVTQCLKNNDMVHLTSFLHELSLLFFRLRDQERLQSSDYLFENSNKSARRLLLQCVDGLICGGMEILGIDIVEEFV